MFISVPIEAQTLYKLTHVTNQTQDKVLMKHPLKKIKQNNELGAKSKSSFLNS